MRLGAILPGSTCQKVASFPHFIYIAAVMKCPVCSNSLRQIRYKSVHIDICPKCKGIWFDSGEFLQIVQSVKESNEISPEKVELFEKRNVQVLDNIDEKDRFCPRCDSTLHKFNYSYDSNVFLDKCSECGGIWADADEVRRVASYLKSDPKAIAIGKGLAEKAQKVEDWRDLSQFGSELSGRIRIGYLLFLPKIIVPLSDDAQRKRIPIVTISIIASCVLVFSGQVFFVSEPNDFVQEFGFISGDFLSVGLISSMFLHGGVFHLLWNMFYLWLFGDNVEDRFNHFGYFVFYLLCGIIASVIYSVFNWGSTIPAIGASGAVSGVMGAYCVFYPAARIKIFFVYRVVHLPAVLFLVGWFLFQLIMGFLSKVVIASEIAWFAHIGGFAFGVTVAYFKKKVFPSA